MNFDAHKPESYFCPPEVNLTFINNLCTPYLIQAPKVQNLEKVCPSHFFQEEYVLPSTP